MSTPVSTGFLRSAEQHDAGRTEAGLRRDPVADLREIVASALDSGVDSRSPQAAPMVAWLAPVSHWLSQALPDHAS